MSSSLHRDVSVTPVVASRSSREILTQEPFGRSCTNPSHCICCSDEAIAGRVLALLPGGMAAVDFQDAIEEVSVALIETAPGDTILVHAKVAIARAAQSETDSGAQAG